MHSLTHRSSDYFPITPNLTHFFVSVACEGGKCYGLGMDCGWQHNITNTRFPPFFLLLYLLLPLSCFARSLSCQSGDWRTEERALLFSSVLLLFSANISSSSLRLLMSFVAAAAAAILLLLSSVPWKVSLSALSFLLSQRNAMQCTSHSSSFLPRLLPSLLLPHFLLSFPAAAQRFNIEKQGINCTCAKLHLN